MRAQKKANITFILGGVAAIFLLVVLMVIYGQKIFGGAELADASTSISLCTDKKATAKSFLLRIQMFGAKKMADGTDNVQYEPINGPQIAIDDYGIYNDCRYKTKIWGTPSDPGTDPAEKDIHKKVIACGNAALVNQYIDYQEAISKSTDPGEKKVYNTKMKALANTAKSLRYTGSLTDKTVSDNCKFDPSLG